MTAIKTLTIRKILDSDRIELGEDAKPMLGKDVEIVISVVPDQKPVKKDWSFLGSLDLGGDLDCVNIRDFAHDD